jgi:hypothetical protein
MSRLRPWREAGDQETPPGRYSVILAERSQADAVLFRNRQINIGPNRRFSVNIRERTARGPQTDARMQRHREISLAAAHDAGALLV